MAKLTIGKGAQEYVDQLQRLGALTDDVIGRAIYPAAGIVADAIKANIEKLPVSNSSKRGTPEDPINTVTSSQKAGLRDGFGITPLGRQGGLVNVKLGFDGYNTTVSSTSKKAGWKDVHQANQMIARAVEGGTSFRRATPFIAPAVRQTKEAAEAKLAEVLDEEIQKLMNQ